MPRIYADSDPYIKVARPIEVGIDKKWQRPTSSFLPQRLTDPFTPRMHAAACRSPQMRVSLTDQAPQLPLVTAPSMGNNRLIAIGDVHGCFHALDAVLQSIEPTPGDRIVFLATWSTPEKKRARCSNGSSL